MGWALLKASYPTKTDIVVHEGLFCRKRMPLPPLVGKAGENDRKVRETSENIVEGKHSAARYHIARGAKIRQIAVDFIMDTVIKNDKILAKGGGIGGEPRCVIVAKVSKAGPLIYDGIP